MSVGTMWEIPGSHQQIIGSQVLTIITPVTKSGKMHSEEGNMKIKMASYKYRLYIYGLKKHGTFKSLQKQE